MSVYDSLVSKPEHKPKAFAAYLVKAIKARTKKGTKVASVSSETFMPRGWDYGNTTVVNIGTEEVSITTRFAVADSDFSMSVHTKGLSVVATGRGNTVESALANLLDEIIATW